MGSVSTAFDPRVGGQLFRHGVVGGTSAGIIFAITEMLMNFAMGRPFLGPLRLISTMVLGPQAIEPSYPWTTVLLRGGAVHLVLSAFFGVIFMYLLAAVRLLGSGTGRLVVYGTLYGFLLWVVNFVIIAPIFFPQFTPVDQFWNGFVAHTFFYGTILGGYVAAVRLRSMVSRSAAEERRHSAAVR